MRIALTALLITLAQTPAAALQADGPTFYREQVKPLLEEHCFKCHGAGRRLKSGLNLMNRAGILAGGDHGPAFDEEYPERSLILAMTNYTDDDHEMPPKGKLPGAALDLLERWVHLGAPYDGDSQHESAPDDDAPSGRGDGMEGWSYQARSRPELPAPSDTAWIANPIDAFILEKLESKSLPPAPPLDRTALIRRATFDLTGLPPTPEQVQAFAADESPAAYEHLIDSLLASPHYGEKWGRHWLDLVRYAETNGFERDADKPNMWRYRDYVIRAFNSDLPYDQFIREQLAGDELDTPTADSIIATGFLRLHQWDDEPGAGALQHKYDNLDDIAKTSAEAFLGMTIGCARCHDHKGDPISQKEYSSFIAYFHGVRPIVRGGQNLIPAMGSDEAAAYDLLLAEKDAQEDALAVTLQEIEGGFWQRYQESTDAPASIASMEPVHYRYYRDTWDALPNFDEVRAEDEGTFSDGYFDLAPTTRNDAFGFVFTSNLRVPTGADYLFHLDSDDGARILLDGEETLRYDGIHGLGKPAETVAKLTAGLTPIQLDYFQRGGGRGLRVWWANADALRWQFTTEDPGENWNVPGFDDSSWQTGLGGFGDMNIRPPHSVIRTHWDTPTIWLRQRFWWDGADATDDETAGKSELGFAVYYDDDLRVYVNGTLALSRDGYITDYTVAAATPAGQAALQPGWNDLAVSCLQDFGGRFVQVMPIALANAMTASPAALAYGHRPLSASLRDGADADLPTLLEEHGHRVLSEEELVRYEEIAERLKASRARTIPKTMAFAIIPATAHPEPLHVHIRGNASSLGDRVEPDVPACFHRAAPTIPTPAASAKSSGRRRALAEWITDPDHPATARVLANRIWQHHFGRGLVSTPNDFGEFGQRPTHPELLDWLAAELVESGWSMKALHRLVMTSNTYRQSTHAHGDATERDAENHLLSRFPLRRLSAEEVRDSILSINGTLNPEMYGPSIYSMMSAEALATSSRPNDVWGISPPDQVTRRSVYIKIKRSLTTPLLAAFDVADTDQSCPERFTTTQPAQALALLNGEFIHKQARLFAERLVQDAGPRLEDQLRRGLHLALGRAPDELEVLQHASLTNQLMADHGLSESEALVDFCLVLYNLNEFVYID